MKHPLPLTALAATCSLLVGLAFPANAQLDTATPAEDAELEAAVIARRSSAEFKQRMDALDAAQQAREAAISAIPQIRAIDDELARLNERMRTLHILRQEILEYYAQTLRPYRTDSEQAQQALFAADPVHQLLESRRATTPTEPADATR
jgi:hypothetical protein